MSVDFVTFCYSGDAPMLHAPEQIKRQVESNDYEFDNIFIIYQNCNPRDYGFFEIRGRLPFDVQYGIIQQNNFDTLLRRFGIDIDIPQYVSDTDKLHTWKNHVVNHLAGIQISRSEYVVFADADCWIKSQLSSWVEVGIHLLENDNSIFIVSPNDGENERYTLRMSQQMFLVRRLDFLNANFNQPNWDRRVIIPGGPMPEYWGMLEGRMELYCRSINKMRYVLGSEWRYWHHNKTNKDRNFELDYTKW